MLVVFLIRAQLWNLFPPLTSSLTLLKAGGKGEDEEIQAGQADEDDDGQADLHHGLIALVLTAFLAERVPGEAIRYHNSQSREEQAENHIDTA